MSPLAYAQSSSAAAAASAISSPLPTTNGPDIVHVVCAWPVSGQYGPGSRVLYYVLVAACILGRKVEWLRNACLAVALVFPAVAGLHGIMLAALHVDGAIDMDVYGAFQLCSIGILAAPTTVRLSRTYQDAPGRNTIFLWTGLVVAGLLSLIVEFYRASPSPCPFDDSGNPILRVGEFPYQKATCSLTCSDDAPRSPMRGGAAANIYVIPIPDKLTFNTALVIAAACCIPAILSLAFTWMQILENNWRRRFQHEDERLNKPIAGTNGATLGRMKGVNNKIREYQNYIEVPLFGAAVLAILVIGELNFFSYQVRYETEPIASIGQWAPIAGTVLAALGTLYLVLASTMEAPQDVRVVNGNGISMRAPPSPQSGSTPVRRTTEVGITRVASALNTIGDRLGSAAHAQLDDSEFKRGKARDFPMIPGEMQRNPNLPAIRELYNPPRDARGDVTPEFRPQRSRSGSFTSLNNLATLDTRTSPSSPVTAARRPTLEVPSPTYHRGSYER